MNKEVKTTVKALAKEKVKRKAQAI